MNLFDLLTDEQQTLFKINTYSASNPIFIENDLCTKLGILLEGEVKISTFTESDKDETITLINQKNPLIGPYLLFSEHPYYLGSGICLVKTSVAWISKDKLLKLFQDNVSFLNEYLKMICSESFKIKQQVKLLAHKNIKDRILFYLHTHQKNKMVKIKSVQNLSDILSLPRPSVSRELTKLEDDGIIKKVDKIIYIL